LGVRSQESGVRSQESGVRSQESGVRSQESGVRSQESGVFALVHDCKFFLSIFQLLRKHAFQKIRAGARFDFFYSVTPATPELLQLL
jgi:hypothetical protein